MGNAMEAKDIGGALAGGLIATELLGALVSKGILTNVDAHRLLLKALKAIEGASRRQRPVILSPQEKVAADAVRLILNRFPDDGSGG